jgi:hypothetical protein
VSRVTQQSQSRGFDVRIYRNVGPLRAALVAVVLAISLLTAGCGPDGGSSGDPAPAISDGKGGPPRNPNATPPPEATDAGDPGAK